MKKFIFITVIATLVGLSLFSCAKKCVCKDKKTGQTLVDLKDNDREFDLLDEYSSCSDIPYSGNLGIYHDGELYAIQRDYYDDYYYVVTYSDNYDTWQDRNNVDIQCEESF